METVVIGGHSRNIGKTSVMAGLIRALSTVEWTAVKITQYGNGICSHDGQPCGCQPNEHAFVLQEEEDRFGCGDTCRFLQAGAKRSLWVRVRQGQLGEAFPWIQKAVENDDFVIIESNSILAYVKPTLYLALLDRSKRDFKHSAQEFIGRCDALVSVKSSFDARDCPALDRRSLSGKPVFSVSAPDYFNLELCHFTSRRLGLQVSKFTSVLGG